jgi:hypothetical protein
VSMRYSCWNSFGRVMVIIGVTCLGIVGCVLISRVGVGSPKGYLRRLLRNTWQVPTLLP